MGIQFVGEHLIAGTLGRIFIWLSILSLVFSAVLFILSLNGDKKTLYAKLAGSFFWLHFGALLGAVGALYYLFVHHCFEYSYIYQYSSLDMPAKYMLSCFWAGQEGSYLIWAFFQGLIGLLLLKTTREWKPWVLPIFSTGQFFILSMVLGFDLGSFSIGGSPFELLRNLPQSAADEFFKNPNYLSMIADGNGLNPLLENIWMIIHPPALFLGYAVALVPFSYAMASLWRKQYHAWLRPAIPWTLAALLTLGIGIILGGRWAYESLTFGGFWAWDPVENASLVPWLLLIATLHTLLIARKRSNTYATTYLFTILSWFFVVYATYLTRSGVLGETSVHSFGENALSFQMVVFCLIFLVLPIIWLLLLKKNLPRKDNDEIMTREFWMLIGAVVAVMSAFQVISTTSIPVFNKIFGTQIAPPIDNINFYNTWQLPFAVAIGVVIAISQYLVYGNNETKTFLRKLLYPVVISVFLTATIAFGDSIGKIDRIVLLFSVLFALVVSISYIFSYFRKTSNIGAALTHSGFSLFLLGVILAFSNTLIISRNTSGFDLGKDADNAENLVLMHGVGQPMGNYLVKYSDASAKGRETFYKVDFVKKQDSASGRIAFSVFPSVNRNTRMGNVYNPDTKHFLDKDIYTYISFAQQIQGDADAEGFSKTKQVEMYEKDSLRFDQNFIILESISSRMENNDVNNAGIIAKFKVLGMDGGTMETEIRYDIVNGELKHTDGFIEPLKLKLRFEGVSPNSKAISVGIYEKQEDFIVIKAIIFPFMIVLWLGTVIMFFGMGYAIVRRIRKKPAETETQPEIQASGK